MTVVDLFIIMLTMFGFWGSYVLGCARGRVIEREASTTATCPCTHVWGEHLNGGECQGEIKRPHYYSYGSRSGYEYVQCVCSRYHGPTLITDEFFHPGVTTQD